MKKPLLKSLCSFSVIVIFLLIGTFSAFASPDTLPGDITSTIEGLITIRNPEAVSSSTTNSKLALSAVASPGTVVTVYRYDANTNTYNKILVDDAPLEATIGASWLFATQVDLSAGQNHFLIRGAWDDETYSVSRFDVSLLNEGFMDRVKGIISVIFN